MLTRMCKEVAGFSNAEAIDLELTQIANKKGLPGKMNDAIGDVDILNLKIIDRKYKQGHTILMMIDAGMIEDLPGYNIVDLGTDSHWVVYEGGLNFLEVGDSKFIHFNIYTWGLNYKNNYKPKSGNKKEVPVEYKFLYEPYSINAESFKSNYYGYIEIS